jgi:hypothetical protein
VFVVGLTRRSLTRHVTQRRLLCSRRHARAVGTRRRVAGVGCRVAEVVAIAGGCVVLHTVTPNTLTCVVYDTAARVSPHSSRTRTLGLKLASLPDGAGLRTVEGTLVVRA